MPTLVGVVPARLINFFTYGNGKRIITDRFNGGQENSFVHLYAAAIASIDTGTATNPIWVVKTRLQLSASDKLTPATATMTAAGSTRRSPLVGGGAIFSTIKQIAREEGIRGFYKGLSASYLGVTEGTIQWVLYERLKRLTARAEGSGSALQEWGGMLGSAGTAKCVASLITYPHEVRVARRPRVPQKIPFLLDVGLIDPILSVPGSPNAVTTAPSGRQEKIYGLDTNAHLRRYHSVGCYTMIRIFILLPFIERRHKPTLRSDCSHTSPVSSSLHPASVL